MAKHFWLFLILNLMAFASVADESCNNSKKLKFGLLGLPLVESSVKFEKELNFTKFVLNDKDKQWELYVHKNDTHVVTIDIFDVSSFSSAKGRTNEMSFETIEFDGQDAGLAEIINLLKSGKDKLTAGCEMSKAAKLAASIPIGPGFDRVYLLEERFLFLFKHKDNSVFIIVSGQAENNIQFSRVLFKQTDYFNTLIGNFESIKKSM